MTSDRPAIEFDAATDADALEQLRIDLRKAGPTSGIFGRRAAEADALLTRVRDFVREVAERRRAREQVQQQQGHQGDML